MIATDPQDIKNLRAAGKILAGVLDDLARATRDGVSAAELDLMAEHAIRARGAVPAFLGYKPDGAKFPFPATLCVSLNDEVVHGLPHAQKLLRKGDVVMYDLGLSYNGLFVDAARTHIVGYATNFARTGEMSLRVSEGDPKAQKLLLATHEALEAAIAVIKPGKQVGDIGAAVALVAKKYGYSSPQELGGHGLGRVAHEAPFVPNYGQEGQGEELMEGMVLAIEPIFCEGKAALKEDPDHWTLRTKDGSRSAEFEDTILVTKEGCEVLTRM